MISEINQRITQLNNGEVPSGYKKTSVGIVPNEWTEHTLGDIFIFKNGLNKEKGAFGQGTPIVNYTDVWKKRGLRAKDINGRVALSEKEIQTYEAKAGDVFFTRTSETIDEIGYSSVLLEDVENAVFSGFVLRARPYNDLVHSEYNQYCYSEPLMRQEIIKRSSMTTRALTSGPMLSQVAINLPSQREQSKIAEILMKWDEAIELYDKLVSILIIKRDAIVQKIVSANAEWKEYSLSDILQEKNDYSQKNNEHVVLSSTKQGIFYQSDYFDKQVASENNIGYKIVCRGDIVLSPQNLWLGNINYNDVFEIGIVSPSYKIFEIKSGYDKTLISTIMKQPSMLHQYVLASEQGASIVRRNLNMDLFYKIKIILPSIEKQNQLGKIIETINKHIFLCKLQLENIKSQRKILQRYLLNGIVRVEV